MNQTDAPPVQVGQELDVVVTSVGEKGDGIARHKGFVLFVAGTNVGDFVHIRVTKVLPKVGFAQKLGEGKGQRPEERRDRRQEAVSVRPVEEKKYEDTDNFGEEETKA